MAVNAKDVIDVDPNQLLWLRQLVSQGEHQHLEFKAKASFPEKIVKELIAFANSKGGTLLLGVDDNGNLSGIKYPDEEMYAVQSALVIHCRPNIRYRQQTVALTKKKRVVVIDVPESKTKPHFHKDAEGNIRAFVRHNDRCLQASREMQEILRRSRSKKSVGFTYGEKEKLLLNYLGRNDSITLKAFCKMAHISRYWAGRTLVKLVLSGVLRIEPGESEDRYFDRN